MQYLHYINFINYGSRFFVLVCIVYVLLSKSNFKSRLHPWIISANNLFLIVAIPCSIAYIIEAFSSMYSEVEYEQYAFMNRVTGPYWWAYWLMIFNTAILPNLFWFKRIRQSAWPLPVFFIPYYIEQCIIMVTSVYRDYLPSSWSMFHSFYIEWLSLALYALALTGTYYLIEWRKAKRKLV